MRIVGGPALWAALLSCAGCMSAGEVPTEGDGAADSVAYKTLTLRAAHTVGWPNLQEAYTGVSHIEKQDEERVTASSDLVVFGAATRNIEIDLDEPNWYWVVGSGTAMVVLHREQGAADSVPWQSVRCGENWQQVQNGYRFFFDGVSIDMQGKTINEMDFANCGIGASERPQFAVFVAAWTDPGSMIGDYDYKVWATCDDTYCTNERGLYPEAIFADNPVLTPGGMEPLPQRATPVDVVREYYRALGEGRVNDVVASWTGLGPQAQARLKTIAMNGRGWTWELPTLRETRNDHLQASVEVEVTATRGTTKYRWTGSIDLAIVINLQTQTSGWKITGMHLTQQP